MIAWRWKNFPGPKAIAKAVDMMFDACVARMPDGLTGTEDMGATLGAYDVTIDGQTVEVPALIIWDGTDQGTFSFPGYFPGEIEESGEESVGLNAVKFEDDGHTEFVRSLLQIAQLRLLYHLEFGILEPA